jgi:hypothetical protein
MPPKKLLWPKTRLEFDILVAESKAQFLPVMQKLQLYQLVGIQEALGQCLDEITPLAAAEDIKRGFRPPGTKIGR